jgi:hypothetical protein
MEDSDERRGQVIPLGRRFVRDPKALPLAQCQHRKTGTAEVRRSAPSLNPELVTALKRLRRGGLLPTLAELLSLCEKQSLPCQDVLLMLLCDEISRRDSGATERRAQQAELSPDMVLSRWDAAAQVTYDRRLLQEICSLRFVADHRNLTILGPVGIGKTFWSQAVAHLCWRGWLPRPLQSS